MDKWFTPQERGIILFLIFTIIVGAVIYTYKLKNPYFAPELKILGKKENKNIDELIIETKNKLGDTAFLKMPSHYNKKININTATKEELIQLPGVGEYYAQKIIDYRNKFGKFNNIEDIMKIKGIGKKKFEKIKDKITI